MCGIIGVAQPGGLSPECLHALTEGVEAGAHRGPDDRGFLVASSATGAAVKCRVLTPGPPASGANWDAAFGHLRLSIIDLSDAGSQPMLDRSGMLSITYNGEIYNYVELRAELQTLGYDFRSSCDTEVILAAYEIWGDTCVERFNGMWAFALLDLRRRRLFCSRDRFGVKPLHYYHDGRRFAFSSEIKQLLRFPFVPRKISRRAVFEFLAYAATDYSADTFFEGISKLEHGTNAILDLATGELRTHRFYAPELKIDSTITPRRSADEVRALLTDSVRLRLRSDVEVGTCLSGGVDSSSIVCLMQRILDESGQGHVQRTFSSHFDEREANELEHMQTVIKATGVRSDIVKPTPEQLLADLASMVWHQEEPFGSSSVFAQWSVYKRVHQAGVKVMLDGQGADEQLAGYVGLAHTYFNELRARRDWPSYVWETFRFSRLQHTPWEVRRLGPVAQALARVGVRPPESPTWPAQTWLRPAAVAEFQPLSRYLATQQVKAYDDAEQLNNHLFQLTFINNLQALLRFADRNSMAFSVESRMPFLDYRLVEYVFGLPARLKFRDGYSKRVLRDAMGGIIPRSIQWRVSKLGFATPERTWQVQHLQPLIQTALADPLLAEYIDPADARAHLHNVRALQLTDLAPWRWLSVHLWAKAYGLN